MISTISTSCDSPSSHRKQTRHWSLIRMLYCPARSPSSFSSRFPGGTAQIIQRLCGVQQQELPQRRLSQAAGDLRPSFTEKESLCLLVSKASDHSRDHSAARDECQSPWRGPRKQPVWSWDLSKTGLDLNLDVLCTPENEPGFPASSISCARHGLALAVLRAVSCRPQSKAKEVAEHVRGEIGTISRQAVYDALGTLAAKGLIRRIQPAGSPALRGPGG